MSEAARPKMVLSVCSRDISLKYYLKERWSTKRPWFGQSSKGSRIVTQLFLEEMRILILTIIELLTPHCPIKLWVMNFMVYHTIGSMSLPSRDFYDHPKTKLLTPSVNAPSNSFHFLLCFQFILVAFFWNKIWQVFH